MVARVGVEPTYSYCLVTGLATAPWVDRMRSGQINRLIVDWLGNGAPRGRRAPPPTFRHVCGLEPISLTCRARQRFRWLVRRPAPSEEEEVLEVARDSRVARRKAS